jgi:hypothetical protein
MFGRWQKDLVSSLVATFAISMKLAVVLFTHRTYGQDLRKID